MKRVGYVTSRLDIVVPVLPTPWRLPRRNIFSGTQSIIGAQKEAGIF